MFPVWLVGEWHWVKEASDKCQRYSDLKAKVIVIDFVSCLQGGDAHEEGAHEDAHEEGQARWAGLGVSGTFLQLFSFSLEMNLAKFQLA